MKYVKFSKALSLRLMPEQFAWLSATAASQRLGLSEYLRLLLDREMAAGQVPMSDEAYERVRAIIGPLDVLTEAARLERDRAP